MKTNNETPIAYSYLRFSKIEQKAGDSTRRQDALRDSWLARNPKVRLDKNLTLVDEGVSAFRGKNRTDPKQCLAQFIDLIRRGLIVPGSYLIIENLDRLTRERPVDAIPAVMELIKLGIRIVQLSPTEQVYSSDMETSVLIMMLLDLSRGHGESKMKSERILEAKADGRAAARENGTDHGTPIPSWLHRLDGRYAVDEERSATVRLIFRLCAEGLGTLAITHRLIEQSVPPIGRGATWARSYVVKILFNRSVLGEYQPGVSIRDGQFPGEPVIGYYPAVIPEDLWHAAHAAMRARNKRSGRPGVKGEYSCAFSGLLRDGIDQCRLYASKRRGKRYWCSANAMNGVPGSTWFMFPLEPLNDAILSQLRELQAADVFGDPGADKVSLLTGRLADVKKRLAVAVARFDADPQSSTWADQIDRCDREMRSLVKELENAEQEASNPASLAWAEAIDLMKVQEPDRLRSALLRAIDDIVCVFAPVGVDRVCVAQVFFKGGTDRLYGVYYEQGYVVPGGRKEPRCIAQSLAGEAYLQGVDLRKQKDARRIKKYLTSRQIDPSQPPK